MARRHHGIIVKDRSPDYRAGHRRAARAAVAWLHRRAGEMSDPHARQILNAAAFNLGSEFSQGRDEGHYMFLHGDKTEDI